MYFSRSPVSSTSTSTTSSSTMSSSVTSLYDVSPVSTQTSDYISANTATCAYPSWPRRPSLHASSSTSPPARPMSISAQSSRNSSRSSSFSSSQRQHHHHMPAQHTSAYIPDDDLFPELDPAYVSTTSYAARAHDVENDDLPSESPVGGLPLNAGASFSVSSMSQREMIARMRQLEAEKIRAALRVIREQRRAARG